MRTSRALTSPTTRQERVSPAQPGACGLDEGGHGVPTEGRGLRYTQDPWPWDPHAGFLAGGTCQDHTLQQEIQMLKPPEKEPGSTKQCREEKESIF